MRLPLSPDEELHRRLSALRAAYLEESPRRMVELWTAFARMQNGDAAALADLGSALHRLAGTGGAYGLARVTQYARMAEALTSSIMESGKPAQPDDHAALRVQLQNLADAFAEAAIEE